MPYIKEEDRVIFNGVTNELTKIDINTKGELEYLIFVLMLKFMANKDYRYSTLHDATYAAIHCGDEFRRRFLDVREDSAKEQNGDIPVFERVIDTKEIPI